MIINPFVVICHILIQYYPPCPIIHLQASEVIEWTAIRSGSWLILPFLLKVEFQFADFFLFLATHAE